MNEQTFAQSVLGFIKSKLADNEQVSALIDKYLGTVEDNSQAAQAVASLVLTVESSLGGDASILDIAKAIAKILVEAMELMESFDNITGAEKKELVQGLLWGLYVFVDRGIDGTKNRVDIPWVPAGLEEKIERQVVRLASGFAIEAIISIWNKDRDVDVEKDVEETAEIDISSLPAAE